MDERPRFDIRAMQKTIAARWRRRGTRRRGQKEPRGPGVERELYQLWMGNSGESNKSSWSSNRKENEAPQLESRGPVLDC
ncbi:unnamed protein product [Heligmosomoides polygyrus]|uniref:Uncharacterized protein n=1 Tax=Heligmosomoides polygyrus TaxID=6339 RepID=A0A183FDX0_HELPZ|nr:unnamed protein product [Heligmosomoides polygyrus]